MLATAALAPATFFMGGTLPILCQALSRGPSNAGVEAVMTQAGTA